MHNRDVANRYMNDGTGVVPQPRLLIMLYDRLVLDLEQADTALTAHDIGIANDKLQHAQSILFELNAALDRDAWSGADNLSQLYSWFTKELTHANMKKDPRSVRICLNLIKQLQQAWHGAYESVLAEQAAAAGAAAP